MESVGENLGIQEQPGHSAWLSWFLPLVIVLLTVVAFFPVLQNGFVNWDDEATLVENPHYRGLGWTQLHWMFTTVRLGHYQPLSWMTFALDYLLWGMNPFGYHLTNLILHAANAILVYFVTFRLLCLVFSGSSARRELALTLGAGFSALVFAIHPLRVESVAWATERRDVLAGLFLLWAVLCYLRAAAAAGSGGQRLRWMVAAVVVYGLSLLSKAGGITLPIVLLILDVYPLRRLGGGPGRWFGPSARGVWWEKVPFFVLAVGFGIIALSAQREVGALKPLERFDVTSRLAQAFFGIVFYLWKTVFPAKLSPLYELPPRFDPWDWPFLLSGLVVVVVSIGLFILRRRWPAGLASWICYIAILLPVLGIAQSGLQLVADRYSYVSCLAWAMLAGAGFFYLWEFWLNGCIGERIFFSAVGMVAVIVVGLGVLTWQQAQVWHDSETLWRHVFAIAERSHFKSSVAHYSVGNIALNRGNLEEAIDHFRQALQIDPDYAEAHGNLGNALLERGALEEALEHYREALRINPAAGAHNNLGTALLKQERLEEAIEHFRRALEINFRHVDARYNLGFALARRGESEEAVKHLRQVLELRPDHVRAHNNLAIALASRGELAEAIKHFRKVLEIDPKDVRAHNNLAITLASGGELAEAIKHFRSALELNPTDAGAHSNLANALLQQGDVDGAIQHLRHALEFSPADLGVRNNLAIILASRGELEEAIRYFKEALRMDPHFAEAHAGLGRALAQQGKRDEAIRHYQEALRILKSRPAPTASQ
jgi:tetratricopeptide (TPR) repeat protein